MNGATRMMAMERSAITTARARYLESSSSLINRKSSSTCGRKATTELPPAPNWNACGSSWTTWVGTAT
jgi:hypothetical protein